MYLNIHRGENNFLICNSLNFSFRSQLPACPWQRLRLQCLKVFFTIHIFCGILYLLVILSKSSRSLRFWFQTLVLDLDPSLGELEKRFSIVVKYSSFILSAIQQAFIEHLLNFSKFWKSTYERDQCSPCPLGEDRH